MSNSSLISYKKISPNRNHPRNHSIDTISIHCVAGQASVEGLGNLFSDRNVGASSNYGVGSDGRIGLYVDEGDRSWCTSSASNDNRAITIEVASDAYHPYAVNDKAYASLIRLLVDICRRNGIKKLLWKGDPSLIGQVSKQNMTVHRWFANKACPGDYLYYRHGAIADAVNKQLGVPVVKAKLDVDGIFGEQSVTRMQEWLGSFVDGEISGQLKAQAKYFTSVTAVEFGGGGSLCIEKLQAKVGLKGDDIDGLLGKQTVTALQKFLIKNKYDCGEWGADGYWGEDTSKAFQKFLNDQK